MKRSHVTWLLCMMLAACIEQRALQQFDATLNRLCIASSPEHLPDSHLQTHAQGCVLVTIENALAAGLDEAGVEPGVYHAQSTDLAFTAYLGDVIIARSGTTLAVMTPSAFQELAHAAAAVHEGRREEEQLREGLGLVLLGNLQAFAPAQPRQLTPEQLALLRKATT